MLGTPRKIFRKRSLSAACRSFDPGSVIAMNRLPTSSSPTTCRVRSKKYCLKILGSSVEPDLLETMNSVLARSMLFSIDLIRAESVESSTCSSGNPASLPNDSRITSGHKLDPPIPSSSTCENFASLTSAAKLVKRLTFFCCSATISSHPSHLSSPLFVHSEGSRAHSLLTLPVVSQSSRVVLTTSDKSCGREKFCRLMSDAITRLLRL